MEKEQPLARSIGHAYAHVQHGIDRLITWGFAQMKKAGEESPSKSSSAAKEQPHYARRIERVTRGILKFVGSAGDAYMKKYEELKREQSPKTSA